MSDGSSLVFGIVAWLLDILIAQMALLDQSKYISHDHETKGGGMLRFWNVLVLVLVLNFESILCDLLASVSLVNKNGCKGKH